MGVLNALIQIRNKYNNTATGGGRGDIYQIVNDNVLVIFFHIYVLCVYLIKYMTYIYLNKSIPYINICIDLIDY